MVKIVVGANFGDEGKGLVTNFLSRQFQNSVIVLSNGGAQRGHTVVSEGRRHVFRHFGSTFKNIPTYCAEDFVLNPIVFAWERKTLKELFNYEPQLFVNHKCKITTPLDMLANQIIEHNRTKKHGSCGLGVWETKRRHYYLPFYSFNTYGKHFVNDVREYYYWRFKSKNIKLDGVFEKLFFDDAIHERFKDDLKDLIDNSLTFNEGRLLNYENIIFENGQGLLLDQDNVEYYPNLTCSHTGIRNPMMICRRLKLNDIEAYYVTRSYLTRHGEGRMYSEVDEDHIFYKSFNDKTNTFNVNQGRLRYGYIDPLRLVKQIKDDISMNNSKHKIVVTHCNEYCPEWVEYFADYVSYDEETITNNRESKA